MNNKQIGMMILVLFIINILIISKELFSMSFDYGYRSCAEDVAKQINAQIGSGGIVYEL